MISISQFEECGATRANTFEALTNLVRLKVITREAVGKQRFSYGFNKYFENWLPEVFETRYIGRGNNFHNKTVIPVDNNIDEGTVIPVGDETVIPVDETVIPVDTKPLSPMIPTKDIKKLTKEKLKKAKPRDENLDNQGVELYRGICHLTANSIQRKAIAETVTDYEVWKEVLTDWMLHGWRPGNTVGMLDKYKVTIEPKTKPKQPAGHWGENEKGERMFFVDGDQ
jgi:hypothetical protein